MPFIGNQPALSYTSFAKQDFTTSATTSYTLDNPVANENELALFINFVRQEPTTAYTASGTSLTLTSATSASDDMYCVFLGKAVQTVNPPSGSVGLSQLSATGTKDSTTFLRGDNTFAAAGLNGWSEDGANNNLLPASASAGIYLGVNSATASNLLDDYEEGTWTPAFSFSSGSVSYSSNLQIGTYRKIGNLVVAQFGLICNSISSPSGSTTIQGLPFTHRGGTNTEASGTLGIVRNLGSSYNHIRLYVNESNTVIQLPVNDTNAGHTGLPGSAFQSNTQIFGTVTYQTN